jgi:hypothetical protein
VCQREIGATTHGQISTQWPKQYQHFITKDTFDLEATLDIAPTEMYSWF